MKMKNAFVSLLFIFLAASTAQGQDQTNPFIQAENETITASKLYLGVSTGVNNLGGLIGVQLEIAATPKLLIGIGAGLGNWGYKLGFNAHYYPKGVKGVFFKGGFLRATGLTNFETEMELSDGRNSDVVMDLKPVDNVFVTIGHSWKVGRKNRFYIEGGYAIALTTDYYEVTSGETLSEDSKSMMQILRPGGLIAALGFEFGM